MVHIQNMGNVFKNVVQDILMIHKRIDVFFATQIMMMLLIPWLIIVKFVNNLVVTQN